MPSKTTCPSCGTSYTFEDQLLGKKARCKKCGQSFAITVGAPPAGNPDYEVVQDQDLPPAAPAPRELDKPVIDVRKKKKKKRMSKERRFALMLSLVVGLGFLFLIMAGTALVIFLNRGPRQPNLVGKWKGAPQVREAVKDVADKVKIDNPLAKGIIENLGQRVADEMLAVTLEFKKGGTVFFSGNTPALGLPPEAFGPWEIQESDQDSLTVQMGPEDHSFRARLVFRDRDTFILSRLDKKEQDPIAFSRVRD